MDFDQKIALGRQRELERRITEETLPDKEREYRREEYQPGVVKGVIREFYNLLFNRTKHR